MERRKILNPLFNIPRVSSFVFIALIATIMLILQVCANVLKSIKDIRVWNYLLFYVT